MPCAKRSKRRPSAPRGRFVLKPSPFTGGVFLALVFRHGCRRCQQVGVSALLVFFRLLRGATHLTLFVGAGGLSEMKLLEAGKWMAQARLLPQRIGTSKQSQIKRITGTLDRANRISNHEYTWFCLPKREAALVGSRARRARQRKTVAYHKRAEPWTWQPARKDGQQTVRQGRRATFFPIKNPSSSRGNG